MNFRNKIISFLQVALLVSASLQCFSQEKKKPVDDEFDIKNYKLEPGDRLIIEVNHTSWLGLPANIKTKNPSIGMNIALMFDKSFGNSNFTLGYGIGFFSHNFHSDADFIYSRDTLNGAFTTTLSPYTRPVSLNRYAEKILEVPIEFRFRTKTDRQFKIHVGGKVGYVVNNFRSIRDNDGKIRVYDIKNVNPFRYGVHFRIGFEQFMITANYYLSEVFNKDKGPAGIHPFAVGLAIIPY